MEELQRFLGELIMVCKMLGGADMESDDHGDRWLSFLRPGVRATLWGQVRATYMEDNPVWEITIGYGHSMATRITEYVDRKDDK